MSLIMSPFQISFGVRLVLTSGGLSVLEMFSVESNRFALKTLYHSFSPKFSFLFGWTVLRPMIRRRRIYFGNNSSTESVSSTCGRKMKTMHIDNCG